MLTSSAEAIEWERGTAFFDNLYCQLTGCDLDPSTTIEGDTIARNVTFDNYDNFNYNQTSIVWNKSGSNIFQGDLTDSVGFGTTTPDGVVEIIDDGGDLLCLSSSDGAGCDFFKVNTNGALTVSASSGNPLTAITASGQAGMSISTTSEGAQGVRAVLFHNSFSPAAFDNIGNFLFTARDSGGTQTSYAQWFAQISDPTDGSESSSQIFTILSNGVQVHVLRANPGESVFNEFAADQDHRFESANQTHMFFIDAGENKVGINTSSLTHTFNVNGNSNFTLNASFDQDVIISGTLYGGSPVKIAGVNITDNSFSHTEDKNDTLSFILKNLNPGTNASSRIKAENDVGSTMTMGIGSSRFMVGTTEYSNATGILSNSRGSTLFANFFKQAFIWLYNPSDDNDPANLVEAARIDTDGNFIARNDLLVEGKIDIGVPGVGGGLDIGEGGSYTKNDSGSTIVQAFTYDASAGSGSRFTEFSDLDASNTWLGDAGDRLYVGSTLLFWATRFSLTQNKSSEMLQMKFYNGTALVNLTHMGILKDNATSVGENILNQTGEKEYITWDHDIESDWARADDVADVIPNGNEDMYWVAFQVAAEGLGTVPIVDEIRVRGTDFDIVSGASYPIFWGQARVEKHERIPISVTRSPGGTGTTNIDIDSAHQQTVFNFNGAGDEVSFLWVLPEGIDTSSAVEVKLDYTANAEDTYEIDLSITKLTEGKIIGAGNAPDYTSSNSLTTLANEIHLEHDLTDDDFHIQDLDASDVISIEIERTDTSNQFYPLSITLHYISFSTGEHI